ncbi:MAG TPA: alkanesulfonate monooxygenase [Bacteroidetes bacterium]|nr:alkanesulfonate monooxygenase [Bacteroidota bacterium]
MDIDLFTTTPQSVELTRYQFLKEMKRIPRQSEKYGYKGILVYSDNRLADPWMMTEMILEETTHLLPMIALQPMYMHPYTVAKKIATIGLIYERQIALNLIAGGFVNDLIAIGDHTPHDKRYDRLAEYTEIIQLLLTSKNAVTYKGEFYEIKNLKLQPFLPDHLQPIYYLSGSSEMARKTASRVGAKLIEYPIPTADYEKSGRTNGSGIKGIRVGILARSTHEKAWSDARIRFPDVRSGELSHQMANKISDSEWHKTLSNQNGYDQTEESVYWLGPFKHYHTFCPYLVGDFEEVARELSGYLQVGCTTCILDIPVSEIDLYSTLRVFDQAINYLEKV